jgi:hypothetical protein
MRITSHKHIFVSTKSKDEFDLCIKTVPNGPCLLKKNSAPDPQDPHVFGSPGSEPTSKTMKKNLEFYIFGRLNNL